MPYKRKYELLLLVDVSLMILLGSSLGFFYLFGSPYERGFYCDDNSIRYPYLPSTVTSLDAYFIDTIIPIGVIIIIEFLRKKPPAQQSKVSLFGKMIPSIVIGIYTYIGLLMFGGIASQVLTFIGKLTIGRLRPHFIDVCKPDWSKINCTSMNTYIDPIPCTTDDLDTLRDARLSFPSGHSSFSAFAMIYLAIYIQKRLQTPFSYLLRPILQLMSVCIAYYITLTRISDYHHHWSDTLCGFILGVVCAFFVFSPLTHTANGKPSLFNLGVQPAETVPLHEVQTCPPYRDLKFTNYNP